MPLFEEALGIEISAKLLAYADEVINIPSWVISRPRQQPRLLTISLAGGNAKFAQDLTVTFNFRFDILAKFFRRRSSWLYALLEI